MVNDNQLTGIHFRPFEGGMELKQVIKMDVQGSIPGWIKNKVASRMADNLMIIVNYIKDGTVPGSIF